MASIIDCYNEVRSYYTSSNRVVPRFRGSGSNLSQASLNREMLEMLELSPEHTIADLGSGCGITSLTFATFGAEVTGYEILSTSVEVAENMADELDLEVEFNEGGVGENIGRRKFDRLHGGYMMTKETAMRYVKRNLKPNGIAVLNVGQGNIGEVLIFRKRNNIISIQKTMVYVNFQEDAEDNYYSWCAIA